MSGRKSFRAITVGFALALCVLAGSVGTQSAFGATKDTGADKYVDAPTKIFELPKGNITGPTFGVGYTGGYDTLSVPPVEMTSSMGRAYEWQVKQGDQWVTVGKIDSGRARQHEMTDSTGKPYSLSNTESPYGGVIDLPLVEGTYTLRLYSPPTAYDAEFVSRDIPYVLQDYNRYLSLREKIADMISPYCKTASKYKGEIIVYANMPNQPGLDVGGLYKSNNIWLMDSMTKANDADLYAVAIHECAHYLQDKVAHANGITMSQLNTILLPIYGEVPNMDKLGIEGGVQSGIERNAQCMAYLMGSYLTEQAYINRNECTGALEANAQAILDGKLPG